MAPEQARGRATDKRTDIWAFGCVLYEMLTGSRPFGGDDVTDTIAAVVRGEPDWSALPPELPATASVYLRRSLQKNPLLIFGAPCNTRTCDLLVPRLMQVHSLVGSSWV
jgi:eukaryotic-like serine/threonine-protein kinase